MKQYIRSAHVLHQQARQRYNSKLSDFEVIVEQEKEIRYYREKIRLLEEQLNKKRVSASENEQSVLNILNEAIELLFYIDINTEMPRSYLHQAMENLKAFRESNYTKYVDWKTVKVDD